MSVDSAPGLAGARPGRQRLPEEVASYVRELIISGTVRPGEFLRIDRIAAEVGVSITPVREGLGILRGQGFVRLLPRRGFVVAPFTQQDIRDLFWAQAVIAGELAARAAKRIDSDHLAQLDHIVKAYEAAIAANDTNVVIDLSHAYHRGINLAAGSIRLARLLDSVVKTVPSRFYATIDGWIDETRHDHPEIVAALRKADANKARRLMEHHISYGADRLIETLEARGLWSEQQPQS
jgi:DNA-binding GntR family transcriptional regulator